MCVLKCKKSQIFLMRLIFFLFVDYIDVFDWHPDTFYLAEADKHTSVDYIGNRISDISSFIQAAFVIF